MRPSISERIGARLLSCLNFKRLRTVVIGAVQLFYDILSAFGEFETAIRRERQMEGIARAKANGIYRGRKPKIDRIEVARLKANGMGPAAIARTLKIGRASVYRALDAA